LVTVAAVDGGRHAKGQASALSQPSTLPEYGEISNLNMRGAGQDRRSGDRFEDLAVVFEIAPWRRDDGGILPARCIQTFQ